jgi:pimeloyl-ACP methyl ester carboxylesterase
MTMPVCELPAGRIHYEEAGPSDGRPVVFVHGYLMAGSLWRLVAERLADAGLRCLAPTWPMGAHPEPVAPHADVSPGGIAGMVAAFCERLDLRDVVLVGNDTGGVVAQLVATRHPERLGALVLTSCDAFERFPPAPLKPLIALARVPGAVRAALAPMRLAVGRRSPLAYGLLAHADVDHLTREWVRPALADPRVADDLRRFTLALRQEVTLEAGARLRTFDKPALVAWSADDRVFPVEDGRRLAAALPQGRFELIEGSRTFSMIDQPDRLAALVGEVAATPVAAAGAV